MMDEFKFYKEINVWKPVDDRTISRYRCFEILPDGKFFVQAKDQIYEDSDNTYLKNLDMYFVESLSKENFEELAKEAYFTIEDAILKHENEFEEMVQEIEKQKIQSSE